MATETERDPSESPGSGASTRNRPRDLVRLARPKQWSKGVFVLIGPVYGAADGAEVNWLAVGLAFVAFGLASSAGYVVNDIRDREADRAHPRKRRRPIASGRVTVGAARVYACLLYVLAAFASAGVASLVDLVGAVLLALSVAMYAANVLIYSLLLKHRPIADVISLALGFVLRVLGGCAAAMVEPSTWLLNATLFISMYLAFGKRLGERQTLGDQAAAARGVQARYSTDVLRMATVMTAVACLITYTGYIQSKDEAFVYGMNLLWPTVLPAVFALLRGILLVERGVYDDPTELAYKDPPFQIACLAFAVMTVGAYAGSALVDRPPLVDLNR